ncbi:MAG: glycosyltransferase [Oligoflexia bacterium]|nr:glycosyltransferase [Oligoflexia bacterium]
MKILVFNQDWFISDLRQAGHEVISCGNSDHLDFRLQNPLIHINEVLAGLPNGFRPDRILWLDNSSPVMITGLEDCDIPALFYSVDTHHHVGFHKYLGHLFDYALVAQRDYIQSFRDVGVEPEWMPLWASRLPDASLEKKHGAVFVGTLNPKLNPERVAFFDQLKHQAPIMVMSGAWPLIFPFSEIVINQTVKGDLNFRVFEAMGSGCMLLTERSGNGLLDLFQEGQHLVTYEKNNVADAAQKIREYLGDLPRARRIAQQGREEIVLRHTQRVRAERVEQILKGLSKRKSNQRYLAAMSNLVTLGRVFLGIEASLAARCYQQALSCADKAILAGEPMGQELACYAIHAALQFDGLAHAVVGDTLLYRLQEANQALGILALACIRSHLNRGRQAEAQALSQRYGFGEAGFQQAEQVIRMLINP